MLSSVKERWSRSGASKQKRSFSPRLERRERVHSRTTSTNTEETAKSAGLSTITTLRPSPPTSPLGSGGLNSSHFAALSTPTQRNSTTLLSRSFQEDNIFATPRRLKSAQDLRAKSSPFSYRAIPSPLIQTHYVPPSCSQPLPELLPRPRKYAPRPHRLVTPQERDLARQALQEERDPIDLCIADNIDYNLRHGILIQASLPPAPLQLVYNVRTNEFRRERRDKLLKEGEEGEVLELEESNPPLMADGRKIILEVPRWSRGMEIWWRIVDVSGLIRRKNARIVFPVGVWWERNFGTARESGMELFIEK